MDVKPFYYQLMHIMLKNTELVIKRFQHCLMHGVTMKFNGCKVTFTLLSGDMLHSINMEF